MKLTVLLPVYNSEKYIQEAVESVLNQTFKDFELLIINDGSTDSTRNILENINDNRIKIIDNDINIGLILTLNKGIKLIETEYFVRMDADDILDMKKFNLQIDYLDQNKSIDILGTHSIDFIDNIINGRKRRLPLCDKQIKTHMFFASPLIHPSVMFRTSSIKNNNFFYDNFKGAEDYELWTRVAKKLKFSNLSKPLIYYRIHKESITQVHSNDKDNRDKVLVKIYNNYFQTHGINLTSNELQTYRNFIDLSIKMDNNYELIEISKVLKKITENVCKNDDLDFKYFEHMVSKYIRLNFEKSNYNFFEINKLITENFKSFIRFDLFNNLLLLKRKVIK